MEHGEWRGLDDAASRPQNQRDHAVWQRAQSTVAGLREQLQEVLDQVGAVEQILADADAGSRGSVSRAIVLAQKVASQTVMAASVEAAMIRDEAEGEAGRILTVGQPDELLKNMQHELGVLYRDQYQQVWSAMTATRAELVAVMNDLTYRLDQELAAHERSEKESRRSRHVLALGAAAPAPDARQPFSSEDQVMARPARQPVSGARSPGNDGGTARKAASGWFDPADFRPPQARRRGRPADMGPATPSGRGRARQRRA